MSKTHTNDVDYDGNAYENDEYVAVDSNDPLTQLIEEEQDMDIDNRDFYESEDEDELEDEIEDELEDEIEDELEDEIEGEPKLTEVQQAVKDRDETIQKFKLGARKLEKLQARLEGLKLVQNALGDATPQAKLAELQVVIEAVAEGVEAQALLQADIVMYNAIIDQDRKKRRDDYILAQADDIANAIDVGFDPGEFPEVYGTLMNGMISQCVYEMARLENQIRRNQAQSDTRQFGLAHNADQREQFLTSASDDRADAKTIRLQQAYELMEAVRVACTALHAQAAHYAKDVGYPPLTKATIAGAHQKNAEWMRKNAAQQAEDAAAILNAKKDMTRDLNYERIADRVRIKDAGWSQDHTPGRYDDY